MRQKPIIDSTLAAEIIRAIASEYRWPTILPVERDTLTLPFHTIAGLAGTFLAELGGRPLALTLRADGTSLFARGPMFGPPTVENRLYPSAPDRFFLLEASFELEFLRDDAGAITGLQVLRPSGAPLLFRRQPDTEKLLQGRYRRHRRQGAGPHPSPKHETQHNRRSPGADLRGANQIAQPD